MMKMQQNMQQNPQQFQMMKPSPEQQKVMQLHMINQMKFQFKSDQEIYASF
jgi:hypothetical protein